MTATALQTPLALDPLAVFEARTLHDAVDPLQEAAEANGLIDIYGQDVIQGVMADAFREVRR